MPENFIQVRDSEKPGYFRLWVSVVEDGQEVEARPLCPCAKGHKTADGARACKKALAAADDLNGPGN